MEIHRIQFFRVSGGEFQVDSSEFSLVRHFGNEPAIFSRAIEVVSGRIDVRKKGDLTPEVRTEISVLSLEFAARGANT
jgi:hypothetical protein